MQEMSKYSVLPTIQPDELDRERESERVSEREINIKTEELLQRPVRSVLGFEVLQTLHRDAILLILCKCVRMYSFGFLAVMLVVYLEELGLTYNEVGLMFTLTLLGDAIISILMTSRADIWGRRLTLLLSSIFTIFTSIMFATMKNFWILLVSAIIGVISPSGNEIGPFMSIELSGLTQVTKDQDRTVIMAWYNLFGCFSSALGGLTCGALIVFLNGSIIGYPLLLAYRWTMGLYALIQIILCLLFAALGRDIEVPSEAAQVKAVNPLSLFLGLHKSKAVVAKLSLLFMLDSFGGSFVLQSIISGWFHTTYNTSYETLGTIVFICNIVAGVSALFAAKLADEIGLVLTMVVTHMPSNVLLLLVPLMPNEVCDTLNLILTLTRSKRVR
jgi:MFS family permease